MGADRWVQDHKTPQQQTTYKSHQQQLASMRTAPGGRRPFRFHSQHAKHNSRASYVSSSHLAPLLLHNICLPAFIHLAVPQGPHAIIHSGAARKNVAATGAAGASPPPMCRAAHAAASKRARCGGAAAAAGARAPAGCA